MRKEESESEMGEREEEREREREILREMSKADALHFYPANKKEKHVFCLRVILRMKVLR